MKKIILSLIAVMACMSINAQVVKVYKNGSTTPEATYTNTTTDKYKVVFEEAAKYVDLGLSVKWATCNVGATSPEEYGLYFAWGDVTGHSVEGTGSSTKVTDGYSYNWSTAPFNDGYSSYNYTAWGKYSSTVIDANYNLVAAYDAATVKWGSDWRMPTYDEMKELYNNTTYTAETLNGVYGFRLTSTKEGYTDKSIFLPATGSRYYTSCDLTGNTGNYWTSTINSTNKSIASHLTINSDQWYMNNTQRGTGLSVRPVSE